ncbi:MAG: hypothetical protein J7K51_02225 [Thermotogae bacterium]|nr:hypothetical protein [Thermotogota bacterium]
MKRYLILLCIIVFVPVLGLTKEIYIKALEGLNFPYPITSMVLVDLDGDGKDSLVLSVLHSGIYVYEKDGAGYWQFRYSSDSYGPDIFDIHGVDIFKDGRKGIVFRNAQGNIFVLVWDGKEFITQWKKKATKVIKKLIAVKNSGRFQIYFYTIDNSIYLYEFNPDLYVYYLKGDYISMPWKITGISVLKTKDGKHLFYIVSTYDGQIQLFEDKNDTLLSISSIRLNANVVNIISVKDNIWGYSSNKAIFGLKMNGEEKMNVDLINDYPYPVDFVYPLSKTNEFLLIGQGMSTGGYPFSHIEIVELEHGIFINYLKTLVRYRKKLSQVLSFIPLQDGGMIGCRDGRVLRMIYK